MSNVEAASLHAALNTQVISKALDSVKQQGEAVNKLIESAASISRDPESGQNIDESA